MRGYKRGKDETSTRNKKSPLSSAGVWKKCHSKALFPKRLHSNIYIYICNWSVHMVVNTDLQVDFNSPKESWIDSSHCRDGGEVCQVWHRSTLIQWLKLRIATSNNFVSIFGGARTMVWDTVMSGHLKYLLLKLGYWFGLSEEKKKHLWGYVSVTSLLLLFCPIGCSLLYFLRIIYCSSVNLRYEVFFWHFSK